jgi:hypothetical protein
MDRSTAPARLPDARVDETRPREAHPPAPAAPGGCGAHPALPVVIAGVWLSLAYTLILLVDVRGSGRAHLESVRPGEPALWLQLFNPNSPTEMLAWLILGLFALGSAHTAGWLQAGAAVAAAGRHEARGLQRQRAFWRLVCVAGLLMLLEDTANVRYRLAEWAELLGIGPGREHLFVVEALWYALIAGVFALAVLRHGRAVRRSRGTVAFGAAAVVLYAVAAIGSVTREVLPWYVQLGARIEALFPAPLARPPGWNDPTMHLYLSDRVFEETLELLGAACLLGAVLAFRRFARRAHVTGVGSRDGEGDRPAHSA